MPIFRRPDDGERRGRLKLWPLVVFGIFAVFYYFSNRETVPITGRSQLVDISPREEAALGLQSYQLILRQEDVVEGGPEAERIRRIGAALAKAAKGEDPGFQWEYNLIRSDQVNAFCLPGGKVAVYSGILPVAANDDGLAVIMGHEIAHAIARHGAERMAQQRLAQFGTLAVGAAVGDMDQDTRRNVMAALGVGTQFGVLLPFSRKHESEADHIGLIYAARACFDPAEAPKVWQRMARAAGSGRAPEFLSTHPDPATRIEQLKSWIPEAEAERAKYCGDRR